MYGNGRHQYQPDKAAGVPENARVNVSLKEAQVEPEYEYKCDHSYEYYKDEGYTLVYDENANEEDQELELYTVSSQPPCNSLMTLSAVTASALIAKKAAISGELVPNHYASR